MKTGPAEHCLALLIIRLRVPILAATLILTLLSLVFLKDLAINSDILSYLPQNDPTTILNTYISNTYGGSQMAVVALEAEDVFAPDVIRSIAALSQQLEHLEGVLSVTSLTQVLDIRKQEDWLEIGRLVDPDALPRDPGRLAAFRQYVLSKQMFRGRIVSPDGRVAIIVSRLREDADKAELAREIRRITAEAKLEEKVTFAGLPFQLVEISDLVRRDLLRLIPLAALLIILSLYLSFRSLRGVLLPLVPALIGTLWTLAVMSLAGVKFSVISNIIPVVLLAVGSAYSIHVLSAFQESAPRRPGGSARALSRVALPVALAALTTMAGFLAFIFGSYLTMIREFGIFCSLGIFFALLLSLTFIPALLSVLPPQPRRRFRDRNAKNRHAGRLQNLARRIEGLVPHRPQAVLISVLLLLLLSAAGLPLIRREVDILSYFRRNTEIRAAEEMMKRTFGGSQTLQILVSADIRDPATLVKMKAMENFLRARSELHNVYSIVELLEEMSFAMIDRRILPANRAQVANLWFLLEAEESLGRLVNPEATEAVIQASLENQNSREIADIVRAVSGYIDSVPGDEVTFQLAGSALLYSELYAALGKSQFQSLALALALVLACNLLLLRSLRSALLGLAPIGFTLFMLFGIMGLTAIPLDVVTVLLGSISLGVGVDYSLHFLHRYRRERSRGRPPAAAVAAVLGSTGNAIFINMVTVSAGFLSLLLAGLIPLRRFALLIACTMLCSGLGALLLLPALLLVRPRELPAFLLPKPDARGRRRPADLTLHILKRVFSKPPESSEKEV
jgi:hydrophobe/amphiphile efflux-3 (HAE3) family protein